MSTDDTWTQCDQHCGLPEGHEGPLESALTAARSELATVRAEMTKIADKQRAVSEEEQHAALEGDNHGDTFSVGFDAGCAYVAEQIRALVAAIPSPAPARFDPDGPCIGRPCIVEAKALLRGEVHPGMSDEFKSAVLSHAAALRGKGAR